MKQIATCVFAAFVLSAVPAAAQFTVTSPAAGSTTNVRAANDFATTVFQDPWDMSQRTDVGWWTFGSDTAIASNYLNPTVANGVFSGTMPGSPSALFLLESGLQATPGGSAVPAGKTGQQYPINAGKYTHLVYRMNSSQAGVSQYVWSHGTIYEDQTIGVEIAQSTTSVKTGWKIYDVNLPALTPQPALGTPTQWNGTIRALQFLANVQTGTTAIQLDWVRLVEEDLTLHKSIAWTGGSADVYLFSDASCLAAASLGRIAVGVSSPYDLFVGALPAGTYYAGVHTATPGEATNGFTCSTGRYVVNDIPTLQFTTPSDEGSSEDFATSRLGNPWDFTTVSDIDFKFAITNDGITQLTLTNEAGVNLGPQTVYLGTSAPASAQTGNVGDPFLFPLFWDGRGKATRIDPARYRILTVEAGIPNKARSLPGGSIGRIVWRAASEPTRGGDGLPGQTVGEHYALNTAAGENTLAKTVIDMQNMPIEPGSLGKSSWLSGPSRDGVDAFRYDPHEFSAPTQFYVKRIKVAALERTVGDLLTLRWTYSKPSGTVSFYREASGAPKAFDTSKPIVTGFNAATGSYTWNTAGTVPDGEYQIFAVFTDGINGNLVYAPTPVVVDHSNVAVAQINLSRTQLNFATFGPIRTEAQTVRLTFSGAGDQCWNTTSNVGSLITITPASGVGATALSIAPAAGANFPGGTTNALLTVRSCTNTSNSRAIAVSVTSYNVTTGPVGSIDTPIEGSTVSGSVAVTGWAADDVQVGSVAICRSPASGETTTPGLCAGQAQVFIGNPVFIDDARPDIEAGNPTRPFNYRAGWGYLMLSNFLPNQGNGIFTIFAYAFDVEGRFASLGSKTINLQNAQATKPFGAIDTPAQGEVVCGSSYINFGWALAKPNLGRDVPPDSSTIGVFIDNVFVGRPGARLSRSDISNAFPPPYDTSHAVGGLVLDTTQFANGVHTIYWLVSDNVEQDGVGSRFFTVSNPCSGS